MTSRRQNRSAPRPISNAFLVLLALLVLLVAILGLITPLAGRQSLYTVTVNQIAQSDIQAPYSLEYISQIKTEEAKAEAERQVELIYSPIPSVRKTQVFLLRDLLDAISLIRNDSEYDYAEKLELIESIPNLFIPASQVNQILSMHNEKWEVVKQETIRVLNSVLSETIIDSQVPERINNLPVDYVNFSESENAIIVLLVQPYIVATYTYDQEATNLLRQAAMDSIEPVKVAKRIGEILVRQGQQITPEIYESLEAYSLLGGSPKWQVIVAAVAISMGTLGLVILAGLRIHYDKKFKKSLLALSSLIFLLFLFSSRFMIPNRTVIPYLFPIPAFGMLMALLFTPQIGLLSALCLSLLIGFNIPSGLEITTFYFVSSLGGILSLGKARRVADYFLAGFLIGVFGSLVILSLRLPNPLTDWIGILTLTGAAFGCGIASASLVILLQFIVSYLLGLTTPLRLIDLSRSDHPLLQSLLQNAPGTYQHSLLVANMAERAAERIGVDSLLTRVGALYHDVGKSLNPGFFIENQPANKANPHEKLSPEKSANLIIAHVTDGIRLARKHHIPNRIIDFILEHHGTLMTRFQFSRALHEAEGKKKKLNYERFRYPGPSPQSIETTLLMLSDQCEARVRAEMTTNESQISDIVSRVIDYCEQQGQFAESNVTFQQLEQIRSSLVDSLTNTYHPRILYPEDDTHG